MAYTEWLSKETGQTYRLPTEAEWEYAARAGTTTARYWGDDEHLTQACAYANVADETALADYPDSEVFNCTDGYAYTAPVGSFKPNAWNLYDMLGNAWEWTCSDAPYSYDDAEKKCSTRGTNGARSLRGGSWHYSPDEARSAYRGWSSATYRDTIIGFRVVALVPKP